MKAWVAAAAVIVVGCSAVGLSAESYSQEMTAAVDAYVADSQDLSLQYQQRVITEITRVVEAAPPDADEQAADITRVATMDYLDVLGDQMLRLVGDIDALSPPSDVRNGHDEFIAAIWSVYGALPDTIADVADSGSLDEIRLALTASGFADGQLRWTAACSALEASVRSLGTGLDLRCVPPVIP